MGFLTYVGKRAVFSFVVIVGELALVFFLTNIVTPNPALIWAGPDASADQIAFMVQLYHLNSPWYVQLWYFLSNFFSGSWGTSPLYNQPVISIIEQLFPVTLELAIFAFILKVVSEVILGVISAMRAGGVVDNATRVFYTVIRSFPPFLLALGLLLLFAYSLNVLPSSQPLSPALSLTMPAFKFYNPLTNSYTGFWLIDNMPILNALLVGDMPAFQSAVSHAILPVIALTLFGYGGIIRLVKTSMLEVLDMDFVRTAKSKGLSQRLVIFRHALRNSLLPAFTLLGLTFAQLVTGSLVVETIFEYYGLGYYIGQSLVRFDTPSLIGATALVTIIIVIANFVTDVGYGILDPRTRGQG
ncbi:MAG: ABC transporter permease [Nitrososphaerales archaeon]